jgi:hypothetical protein
LKHTILFCVVIASIAVPAHGQAQGQNAASSQRANTVPHRDARLGPPALQPPGTYRRYDGRYGGYIDPVVAAVSYRDALATADCMLEVGRDRLATELARPAVDESLGRDLYGRYRGCVRSTGVDLGAIIAGAVAERLLASRIAISAFERAPHVNADQAEAFHGDLSETVVAMDSVARCAAVYSPGLAFDVLRTEVGSKAEENSLDALFARTPECGLAGRPAAVPAAIQRGAVAAALYRWTQLNG